MPQLYLIILGITNLTVLLPFFTPLENIPYPVVTSTIRFAQPANNALWERVSIVIGNRFVHHHFLL